MTANDYSKQQFNVMSQFCDLIELKSSDEEVPNENNETIIHPTIPKNNNTLLLMSKFCDLSQLEDTDNENNDSNEKEIEEIEEKKQEINEGIIIKEENICPFRKILMFGMHLHLVGCVLPKWMVDVITLFNDSKLKLCSEAASLGKQQRKLFSETICSYNEPENFIYVNTTESIEINLNESNYCSNWAIVNVSNINTKYCNLKSKNGYKLNETITNNNNLMINKGVYLFYNYIYKKQYIDTFLYNKNKNKKIFYYCEEYKLQQREHIKKIFKLDYDIQNVKYSEWFLNIYDKYLLKYDLNDCYELLFRNIKFWVDIFFNKSVIKIQLDIDNTFVVKTIYSSEWIDDNAREFCSYKNCSVKFGIINRKHHCRSCGDIFCSNHCLKQLYKRNNILELQNNNNNKQNDFYQNEREMRICTDCKQKKYLFVDIPHKHYFMNCRCLNWNVNEIDFQKQWKTFKSLTHY